MLQHKRRADKFLAGRSSDEFAAPASALDLARRQHTAMLAQPRASALSSAWTPVGPLQIATPAYGNVTGRITAIAIDPADATGNTVYIGTTGGGVWKSTNAAGAASSVTFAPLTDTLPVFSLDSGNSAIASLSIGALSVANGIVLAGTGDPNDALDSYYGEGILRSADGGATWTLIQQSHDVLSGNHSFDGLGFAGFAWSSVTPTTVVAALSDAAEGVLVNAVDAANSVRGLYYSTDAGVTWQMAEIKDGSQIVQMPAQSGANNGGNAATSVAWNPIRQRFYAAVRFHGYYESVDGSVWTRLAAQPGIGLTTAACPTRAQLAGSTGCPIFRGVLAVEPSTGDTFAFTVDSQNVDQGIWQDACALNGTACASSEVIFATRLDSTPLEEEEGIGSAKIFQGDYNLSLSTAVSGADTVLFAGTADLFRCSLAAGCAFRNTTNIDNGCAAPAMVAPAQHAIATLATASAPLVFIGNDGGLWRSTDGVNQQQSPCSADDASHFQNLNSGIGSLTEVVSFSQHPSDPDTLLIGAGANGSAATSTASLDQPWPQLASGEGGVAAIDPATPSNWYLSNGPGVSIAYCGKGASCGAADFAGSPTIGAPQVADDASLIDPPWILDPSFSSNLLIGTCRVWRGPAASGSNWSSDNILSTSFGGPKNASCLSGNPLARSIAIGGPDVTNPASTAAANEGSSVVYTGLAGVLDGGGGLGGHLFSTTTAGTDSSTTAWGDLALSQVTNDQSNLGIFNPGGFDVSSVVVDSHDPTGGTVYATVMGFGGNGESVPHVYRSTDAGGHWSNINSNLPNAPANSLVVDPNNANTVYVALDTGVYVTTQIATCASSNCWSIFGLGLPNAPVVQLSAASAMPTGSGTATGELRAATYGRGIWQTPLLTASTPLSAAIQLTPASLTFSAEALGVSSAAQTITITNSGTAPLLIKSVNATGDFNETDNCVSATIAINASCAVGVTFAPTATGTRSGTLTIYANVPGGQAAAALTGVGKAPAAVALNPLNLDFGTVISGATSLSQNITIANTGGADATLQPLSITGDFQMYSNTCGSNLPAGVACTVAVVFSPMAAGTRNGVLTVPDSSGTQMASLTGIGASPATDSLSPLSLSFGPHQAGTLSASQDVTLSNAGDSALTLIAAQITSGDFTVTGNCGSSLAGHATCTLLVVFAPTVAGPLSGSLTVSDQFRTQAVALSGVGVAPPQLAVTPSAIAFPSTLMGQSSEAQTITVSNSGGGSLSIGAISVTSGFAETDNCAGKSLTNSADCTVQVIFSPNAAGPTSGTLTISASAIGSSATQKAVVALSGTGVTKAAIVLTPTSLSFATITLGSTSPAQNITISNTGGQTATLQGTTIAGDFAITANTCGASLAPATGCTMAIVFTPTASGARTGSVSVVDSAGTQSASLTGNGASVATDSLSPLSLVFAPQQLGTSSAAQLVTLTNSGDSALTLIAATITSGDFSAVSGCAASLSGHSSCTIAVAATPKSLGTGSGVLTLSDQFRSQTIALSGAGVAPPGVSLTPSNGLTFATTGVSLSSSPQTITLSNQGGEPLSVTGVTATGDFTVVSATNTCSGSVGPSASCSFQVVFAPTAGGARVGSIAIADNALASPQMLTLQGIGVDFALAANGATSVTVSSGQSAVFPLLLSSDAGVAATATMTCSGTPANATCVVTPANPALGQTSTVSATVETGVTSTARLRLNSREHQLIWWAALFPFAVPITLLGLRRRDSARLRRLSFLGVTLAFAAVFFAVGCGSGRTIPPPFTSPGGPSPVVTPSGSYPITVTATSAGLTKTVLLTLIVQ